MKKILFYIDTLCAGGAEKVLVNLVNAMDPERFSVTVATPFPEDRSGLAAHVGCLALYPAKNTLTRYLYRLESALGTAVRRLPRDFDIEVAYLECGPTKVISASKSRAKKVAWVHCDLMLKEEDPWAFAKKTTPWYAKFDRVVCVSESVRESFRQLYNKRFPASVLYNVNDEEEIRGKADAFVPETDGVPTLCAVGRLTDQKNFLHLLRSLPSLKRDGIPFRLQIIGEGPERQKLEEYITRKNLGDCVQLLGWQENPYPYMKAADMIVCSSRYEGLSTVVTEALILSRPVVTTPCNGMAELLGDSEFGLIAESDDNGLHRALRRMLTEPGLGQHYAEQAARRGRDFRREALARKTEDFFTELLEGTDSL
jgi:glycosyltransferase involved in cell wall biosynthesis